MEDEIDERKEKIALQIATETAVNGVNVKFN